MKKNTKELLFERMYTIGGMPLKEDFSSFIKNKNFQNPKTKQFFYHGTSVHPTKFELRYDYEWEDSNDWSGDLPQDYIFLTTDIKEAKSYGQYIIPCELKRYDNMTFRVYSDNPSRVFDMDYGIDLYMPDKQENFFYKFEESGKSVLIIKGNNKSTIITHIDNLIARTDLAIEYYQNN